MKYVKHLDSGRFNIPETEKYLFILPCSHYLNVIGRNNEKIEK